VPGLCSWGASTICSSSDGSVLLRSSLMALASRWG
jgi:hypothetical protein